MASSDWSMFKTTLKLYIFRFLVPIRFLSKDS